jgi:hypothetical protein
MILLMEYPRDVRFQHTSQDARSSSFGGFHVDELSLRGDDNAPGMDMML